MTRKQVELQLKKVKASMSKVIAVDDLRYLVIGFGLTKARNKKYALHFFVSASKPLSRGKLIKLFDLDPLTKMMIKKISFSSLETPASTEIQMKPGSKASKVLKAGKNQQKGGLWSQEDTLENSLVGASISNGTHEGGTLCCFVMYNSLLHFLSCSHVIALANEGRAGDPIISPSALDGGMLQRDEIGALSSTYFQIDYTGNNTYDAALAIANNNLQHVRNAMPEIGFIDGLEWATEGMKVAKYGKSTKLTYGTVVKVDYSIGLPIHHQQVRFIKQIVIKGKKGAFATNGDSGALIVNVATKRAIGLLCAVDATKSVGFANQLMPLLSDLGAELV